MKFITEESLVFQLLVLYRIVFNYKNPAYNLLQVTTMKGSKSKNIKSSKLAKKIGLVSRKSVKHTFNVIPAEVVNNNRSSAYQYLNLL